MNTSSTHLLALSSIARRGQCCLQLLETVIVDVIHTQQSGIHDFCLLQCFCCTLNQVKLSNQGREFKLHVQVDPRRWKRNSMASNDKTWSCSADSCGDAKFLLALTVTEMIFKGI